MPRHIALLRGINVGGGHVVKMQQLRKLLESLGLRGVETVIASGNVVFESSDPGGQKLEQRIERVLRDGLGFEVTTFLRTVTELKAVVENHPFKLEEDKPHGVVFVVFLRSKPAASMRNSVEELNTNNDKVTVKGREVYWLSRERSKDSHLFATRLSKLLGSESTMRNMNTVRRIVAKYC